MFRRILVSLAIIPILILLVYGYLRLRNNTANNKDALSVLPNNPMLLMEWHGLNNVLNSINIASDTSLQKHLAKLSTIKSCIYFLSELKQQIATETGLDNAFKNNNVYAALYQNGNKANNWFFCTSIPKEIDERVLLKIIKSTTQHTYEPLQNGETFELKLDTNNKLYFYFLNGIFAASQNQLLLKTSWLKLNSERKENPNFELEELMKLSKTDNSVSIYAHNKNIIKLLNDYCVLFPNYLQFKCNENSWISADVELNSNQIFSTGFFSINNKLTTSLAKPQGFEMATVIPANIASVEWWNDANFSTTTNSIKKDNSKNWQLNIFDKALALVNTTALNKNINTYTYQILQLKENVNFVQQAFKADTTLRINLDADSAFAIETQFLKPVFFDNVSTSKIVFAKQIGNFLITANNKTALTKYVQQIAQKNTLANNIHYKLCADKVFSKANYISIYNPQNFDSYLTKSLTAAGNEVLNNNAIWLNKFNFLFTSISNNGKQLQQNMYAEFLPNKLPELTKAWQTNFDSEIKTEPIKIHSKQDSCDYIVLQNSNKIFVVNSFGKITNSIQLNDSILGNIASIKSKKSKNEYCYFNTTNKLYVYNANGEIQNGFPVRLKENTKSAASIFYNADGEARIMIACNDHKVYLFDLKGKPIEDWKNPLLKANILLPIVKTNNTEKPIYAGFDSDGNYFCLDSKGRKTNKKDSTQLKINSIQKYVAIGKQSILAITKNVAYIIEAKSGKINDTLFFDTNILDVAIDNNSKSKIALLTSKGIISYNIEEKTETWTIKQKFERGNIGYLHFYNEEYVYCTDKKNSKIYLFATKNNQLVTGFPIHFMQQPTIIKTGDEFENNLFVTAKKNKLIGIYINEK